MCLWRQEGRRKSWQVWERRQDDQFLPVDVRFLQREALAAGSDCWTRNSAAGMRLHLHHGRVMPDSHSVLTHQPQICDTESTRCLGPATPRAREVWESQGRSRPLGNRTLQRGHKENMVFGKSPISPSCPDNGHSVLACMHTPDTYVPMHGTRH